MATMKGREANVRVAIESLMNNTVRPDEIILYDNSAEPIDLTDNGKFFGLSLYTEPVYYFTADDDLIYPKDYIQRTIEYIDRYKCIITYHGRILKGEGLHYYRGHRSFRFADMQHNFYFLDVCGTGVSAWSTATFNPVKIHTSEHKRMSDLVLSLEAARQGVHIMLMPHTGRWIKQQQISYSSTILGTHIDNCTEQGQLADQIYRLNHGSCN